ncbi:MAG: hypothetical protein IT539_08025 [Bradyrhizobiaceae bacterium]|nr:hypothetical protein [Bradyrhizobiaceae bacterium]
MALAVAAQAGSFAAAASLPAFAEPCRGHAALAPVQADAGDLHHAPGGHGSAYAHDAGMAEAPESPDDVTHSDPPIFACCLGHAVAGPGALEPSRLTLAGAFGAPLDAALAPGEIMRADPPPRDLL